MFENSCNFSIRFSSHFLQIQYYLGCICLTAPFPLSFSLSWPLSLSFSPAFPPSLPPPPPISFTPLPFIRSLCPVFRLFISLFLSPPPLFLTTPFVVSVCLCLPLSLLLTVPLFSFLYSVSPCLPLSVCPSIIVSAVCLFVFCQSLLCPSVSLSV